MKHIRLIAALLLVSLLGSFVPVHAQAVTRVTACDPATPNNAICITGTAISTGTNGEALTGVTYSFEQKAGSGSYAPVATALASLQYYAKNLVPGAYTWRAYVNCTNPGCVVSAPSNAVSGTATPTPIQPNTPVLIIAATIRADGPPIYRIVYTVTPRAGEIVFVAPASMRPYFH